MNGQSIKSRGRYVGGSAKWEVCFFFFFFFFVLVSESLLLCSAFSLFSNLALFCILERESLSFRGREKEFAMGSGTAKKWLLSVFAVMAVLVVLGVGISGSVRKFEPSEIRFSSCFFLFSLCVFIFLPLKVLQKQSILLSACDFAIFFKFHVFEVILRELLFFFGFLRMF